MRLREIIESKLDIDIKDSKSTVLYNHIRKLFPGASTFEEAILLYLDRLKGYTVRDKHELEDVERHLRDLDDMVSELEGRLVRFEAK